MSRTTLWRMVRAGAFPRPARVTERNCGFVLDNVEAWMKARAAGMPWNRNGLAVAGITTIASGHVERDAALQLIEPRSGGTRRTLGADKAYDTADFVAALRGVQVTPHVTQNTTNRSSAIDSRTTRHAEYEVCQKKRKQVEEIFGWMKTVGILRKVKLRGQVLVNSLFRFGLPVYNLVRRCNLTAEMAR